MIKTAKEDLHYMRNALSLACRGLGRAWPNPTVGCVIVNGNNIVGRGWTQPMGRPHAETEALRRAGEYARGSTAYVTLEPCSHEGSTPPCAKALIDAGISRAVISMLDPDPRVDGRGVTMLRENGTLADVGLCAEEAENLNAGFIYRFSKERPYITLKCATSIDAKLATRSGESQWITGQSARSAGQMLRAQHDAVLVGSATALTDDPSLTCRLSGLEDLSPVRILLDRRLRLPLSHILVKSANIIPTWVFTREPFSDEGHRKRDKLLKAGVEVFAVDTDKTGRLDLFQLMTNLVKRGITRLMVEGGGLIAASFVSAGLVDELLWFRAPCIIGGDGRNALAEMGVNELSRSWKLELISTQHVGSDILERYRMQS